MTVLVSIETVLLVLLIVLVAGLLRSHAELLRRLGPSEDGVTPAGTPAAPARTPGAPAPSVTGRTPTGDAISLSFEGGRAAPTLLAFLTSGCSACASFWDELAAQALPGGIQTVIVTHGSEREQPARLRTLAPPRIPVVMSSEAWHEYAVPGAPYFVLVDGSVRGEGVANTWRALSSLVGDAIEDVRHGGVQGAGNARSRRIEETFAAAGIGPDHESLYPAGREGS